VGAQGPMQFMPPTWGEWGEGDVHDPRDAILAAGRYLRWGGMPDDVDGAIFRYNRDVRYVEAVRSYAEEMQADERAFFGYYHWQVYFSTGAENVWLAVGYDGGAS
jgi:soluble lytic murein transglycosylase-like protein